MEKLPFEIIQKGIPMPFESKDGKKFMGIIKEVDRSGKLHVILENDSVKAFDIKEVSLLY